MTPDELAKLQELGRDLAAAEQSDWQPRIVAEAWRSPVDGEITLTMQGWIDLDDLRSPLLAGGLPEHEDLAAAAEIFGLDVRELSAEEQALVAIAMQRAVARAFRSALRMSPPEGDGGSSCDGFGDWLPMLGMLITQCGVSYLDALKMPVDRAFQLLAVTRRNEGWRVAGTPYAYSDIKEKEEKANG